MKDMFSPVKVNVNEVPFSDEPCVDLYVLS